MSYNPYSVPASLIPKVHAAQQKAIKTGGIHQIGKIVTVEGGTWGRKFKGTVAKSNMVRIISNARGKVVDITKYWTGYSYSRRYQVDLGKRYGKLWFNATQLK